MANKELTPKKLIQKDIGNYASLEAVKNSEGGKLILTSLKKDVQSCLDEISSKYKTATHAELIATSAKLAERLTIYRMLTRSTKNKHLAQNQLDELLEEPTED